MKEHAEKTKLYARNCRIYNEMEPPRSISSAGGLSASNMTSRRKKNTVASKGTIKTARPLDKGETMKLPPTITVSRHKDRMIRDDTYTNYFVSTNQLPPSMTMKTSSLYEDAMEYDF